MSKTDWERSVDNFIIRVNDKAVSHTNKSSPSIYTAPVVLRELGEDLFKPRVVSIGPLHRKDTTLQQFEEQKLSCVKDLLNRGGDRDEKILESMQKVYKLMEKIKGCYDLTLINTYTVPQIAEMMVMDACFILEFINHQYPRGVKYSPENRLLSRNMIFDLVLLENQIPLFVLDEIYHCTITKNYNDLLFDFIYPLLNDLNIFKSNLEKPQLISNIDNNTPHILSLLRECYKPPVDVKPVSSFTKYSSMYSAVHLDTRGVNFRPNNEPTWGMEMKVKLTRLPCCIGFCCKPTIEMPVLRLHGYTEVILRNLIAYEQSHETCNYIISYASTMDMLVCTQEDVSILVKSEVIESDLGSNEDAAKLIIRICKKVTFNDFFYSSQCETLTNYCKAYWPKNIIKFTRTYLNSPWSIIGLGGGIGIFILTLLQTIYTMKSYKSS